MPFAIHVGGDDTAFDRDKKAMEWGMRLEQLAAADPDGYVNQWHVHAGKPHWMDMEDAVSIPFLQSHTRDPIPRKIVWEQADVTRATFYLVCQRAERRHSLSWRSAQNGRPARAKLACYARRLNEHCHTR